MTRKGYVYKGLSGWTCAFWDGERTRFLHGYSDFDVALTALKMFWRCVPEFQNGFPTIG